MAGPTRGGGASSTGTTRGATIADRARRRGGGRDLPASASPPRARRARATYWKSGFYRIWRSRRGIPVDPSPRPRPRTVGWGADLRCHAARCAPTWPGPGSTPTRPGRAELDDHAAPGSRGGPRRGLVVVDAGPRAEGPRASTRRATRTRSKRPTSSRPLGERRHVAADGSRPATRRCTARAGAASAPPGRRGADRAPGSGTRPPGRSTRRTSRSAASTSGIVQSVNVDSTASYDSSAASRRCPSRPTRATATAR